MSDINPQNENFWFHDPSVLFTNWSEIIPLPDMSYEKSVNAITRLVIYATIGKYTFNIDPLICVVVFAFFSLIYSGSNKKNLSSSMANILTKQRYDNMKKNLHVWCNPGKNCLFNKNNYTNLKYYDGDDSIDNQQCIPGYNCMKLKNNYANLKYNEDDDSIDNQKCIPGYNCMKTNENLSMINKEKFHNEYQQEYPQKHIPIDIIGDGDKRCPMNSKSISELMHMGMTINHDPYMLKAGYKYMQGLSATEKNVFEKRRLNNGSYCGSAIYEAPTYWKYTDEKSEQDRWKYGRY